MVLGVWRTASFTMRSRSPRNLRSATDRPLALALALATLPPLRAADDAAAAAADDNEEEAAAVAEDSGS